MIQAKFKVIKVAEKPDGVHVVKMLPLSADSGVDLGGMLRLRSAEPFDYEVGDEVTVDIS